MSFLRGNLFLISQMVTNTLTWAENEFASELGDIALLAN